MGQDNVVGKATRCGLDDLTVESLCRAKFSAPVLSRPRNARSLPYDGYQFIPEVKAAGPGVNQPPPSSADVKEIAQLYLYSPSVPS